MPIIARMLRKVPLGMSRPGWTGTGTVRPSGCRMMWWLPLIRVTSKPARSKAWPPWCRERRGLRTSGDVERQRQLWRHTNLFDEHRQGVMQVRDSLLGCGAVADRTDTGPQLSSRAPDAVFVLFQRVGHVNDPAHGLDCRRSPANRSHGRANGPPPSTGQRRRSGVSGPFDGQAEAWSAGPEFSDLSSHPQRRNSHDHRDSARPTRLAGFVIMGIWLFPRPFSHDH